MRGGGGLVDGTDEEVVVVRRDEEAARCFRQALACLPLSTRTPLPHRSIRRPIGAHQGPIGAGPSGPGEGLATPLSGPAKRVKPFPMWVMPHFSDRVFQDFFFVEFSAAAYPPPAGR